MPNRQTAQYKHAGKKQRYQCQSLYQHSKTGLKDKSRGLSNQSANALSIYRTQQLNAFKEKGAKHLRNRKGTSKNWIRSTFGFVQVDLFWKRNLNMILWLSQGLLTLGCLRNTFGGYLKTSHPERYVKYLRHVWRGTFELDKAYNRVF